jgi:hypothetical protein
VTVEDREALKAYKEFSEKPLEQQLEYLFWENERRYQSDAAAVKTLGKVGDAMATLSDNVVRMAQRWSK